MFPGVVQSLSSHGFSDTVAAAVGYFAPVVAIYGLSPRRACLQLHLPLSLEPLVLQRRVDPLALGEVLQCPPPRSVFRFDPDVHPDLGLPERLRIEEARLVPEELRFCGRETPRLQVLLEFKDPMAVLGRAEPRALQLAPVGRGGRETEKPEPVGVCHIRVDLEPVAGLDDVTGRDLVWVEALDADEMQHGFSSFT